jgi:hypothetical protein
VAEVEGLSANLVECAAGGGDDDVDAAAKYHQLLVDGLTAVDREHSCADGATVLVNRLGDLHCELSRGHENECAHVLLVTAAVGIIG